MRIPWKRLLLTPAAALGAFIALPISSASAQTVFYSIPLWNYYSPATCVAIGNSIEHTDYPSNSWNSSVAAASDGGSLSWSATIAGWVGITYTPTSSDCQRDFVVNTNDLIVHAHLLKWTGSSWAYCTGNIGSVYGSYWKSNSSATWGLSAGGGSYCGAGWYVEQGTGMAWENGQWRGYEPYLSSTNDVYFYFG